MYQNHKYPTMDGASAYSLREALPPLGFCPSPLNVTEVDPLIQVMIPEQISIPIMDVSRLGHSEYLVDVYTRYEIYIHERLIITSAAA